jgi:homoserine dehydrogenase
VRTKGDRRWIFEGTGAGRSPTTEAIIGDLLAHANVQETIDSDDQEVTR